jgi:hypothetical protein
MNKVARRQVALWLFVCSAMVFAILVVGGVTRLTHSGLSIVEWKPIVGIVPPLNQAEWDETFEKYKKTPEYQKVNHQMGLEEFKRHLLLGVLAPCSRAPDRCRLPAALPLFLLATQDRPAAAAQAARHLRARRAAGRDGLVHGQERPDR